MKIVALHMAFPVDGMHVIPASAGRIVHDGDAFVVVLGSRVFRVPRALCIVEGVEEPAVEPQPVTVPEVRPKVRPEVRPAAPPARRR